MVTTGFSVWRKVFYPLYVAVLVGILVSLVFPPFAVVEIVLAAATISGMLVVGFVDWLRHPDKAL